MESGVVIEDQALFFSLVTLVTKGQIGILSWYVGILSLHLI